jgi:hypothetical protein
MPHFVSIKCIVGRATGLGARSASRTSYLFELTKGWHEIIGEPTYANSILGHLVS